MYPFWDGSSLKNFISNQLNAPLRDLGKLLNIEGGNLHPHRFRDSFAVNELCKRLRRGDASAVEAVARLLGHKDPKITREHYLPYVDAINKAIAERGADADELAKRQAAIRAEYEADLIERGLAPSQPITTVVQ